MVYFGWKLHCPICGHSFRKFLPAEGFYYIRGELVDHYTKNAHCPNCGSGLRYRMLLTYLLQKLDVNATGTSILHVAPEPGIYEFFVSLKNLRYFPCDLRRPKNPHNYTLLDVTQIPISGNSVDVVICSHVLEHIQDDIKAIAELYRVLKKNGMAFIAVPIYGEKTYEDPSLDEEGRTRMYGISDHVRLNGLDVVDKLKAAGFTVNVLTADDIPGNYVDRSVSSPHVESDKYLFSCVK